MRIVYEYAEQQFPRYFSPARPGFEYADTLREAHTKIRSVVGKTRCADLQREMDARVIERRRNRDYIATIVEEA